MTMRRDPDRLIHAFLLEGQTELADQVYDAVRSTVEHRRQRVFIGPRRFPDMNKLVPIGVGAAAVIAVFFVGARFLGAPTPNQPGAAPTVVPTATPSPVPSEWAGLPAGPHVLAEKGDNSLMMTVTIAAPKWIGDPGVGYVIREESPDQSNGGMMGFQDGEYYVYGDACHYITTKPQTPATTVDEVIRAMANQASREASAPEDITVDGYGGKKIILHPSDDLDITTCDEGGDSLTLFGSATDGRGRYGSDPPQVEEVWALDVDGRLVILDGLYYPDTPQNVVDEVRALLASTTFE
jgi:hypothetical protein